MKKPPIKPRKPTAILTVLITNQPESPPIIRDATIDPIKPPLVSKRPKI